MKLLVETTEKYKVINENNADGEPELFIAGIFMQAEKENRNGRVYPREIMAKEVARYNEESVNHNRAVGELGHPAGPQINMDRVCTLITELRMIGDDVVGKAKVLDTPSGEIVKSFIRGGVGFGVSSRALGSTRTTDRGIDVVMPDFQLFAIDVVFDPSAPDAYVNALMEEKEWVWENGLLMEKTLNGQKQRIDKVFSSNDTYKKSAAIRDAFYEFIKEL